MKQIILNLKSVTEVKDFLNELTEDAYAKATVDTLIANDCHTVDELQTLDSMSMEFDCGWIVWEFEDEELSAHMRKLSKKSGYDNSEFRLRELPIQGTNIKRTHAAQVAQHLNEIGIPVKFKVHLD